MSEHLSVRGVSPRTKILIAAEAARNKTTQAAIIDAAIQQYINSNLKSCVTEVTQLDRIEAMLVSMLEAGHE